MSDGDHRKSHVDNLTTSWSTYSNTHSAELGLNRHLELPTKEGSIGAGIRSFAQQRRLVGQSLKTSWHQTVILMERNMINYARNLLAYGVRLAMYGKLSDYFFWKNTVSE